MPTNFLRSEPGARPRRMQRQPGAGPRRALLETAHGGLSMTLADTQTAELIWRALPLRAVAETWGSSIHFEIPVHAPRERTARLNGRPGEVYYWADDERIVIAWGPTPISRPDEIRLMRPCNVWAHLDGDAAVLAALTPGEKVSLVRLAETAAT